MNKLIILITILSLSVFAYASENFSDALKGVDKTKVIVDLNQGKPALLNLRLKLIKQTFEDIKAGGSTPDVIVAVRGGASRFMTKSDSHINNLDSKLKTEMQKRIRAMVKEGVRFQQCGVAINLQGIGEDEIIEEIEVVKNGYVSLVGYQNKGYALLPME
ncbi:DsrE family protein [Limisalsivibrio acetivorans]|uniref:DsrE family protein n=1 Tax=Limisalsivibrio acetivorans TaxID=1304888 RepID=UPI0003B75EB4|nr:DsrE family protein [Limisalsivibrio acetivorans]